MAKIKINGRAYFFGRVISARSVGAAYHVETFHGTYTIDGGKRGGGSRRDWFVTGEHINPAIVCTSVVDALRLLDTM